MGVRGKAVEEGTLSFKACACPYFLEREAAGTRLVVNCKETLGPANLNAPECRARAIEILSREVNVDSVIMAHYRETQYSGPAMQLLQRMEKVSSEFRHLSLRNPYKTYFEPVPGMLVREKKEQQKQCEICPWNPMTLFDNLAKGVREQNPVQFCETFINDAGRLLKAEKPPVCNPCLATSRSEMEYTTQQIMDFRSFILYEAFRVVEPRRAGPT